MRFKVSRESFIRPGAIKVRAKNAEAVVYISNSAGGRPSAIGFAGKADRPSFNHWFGSEAQRAKFIAGWIEGQEARAKSMLARRVNRKTFVHSLKVGDILSNCWGYDQTNREFYEVTKLVGKTMCEIRELACQVEQTGPMHETIVPMPGHYRSARYEGDDCGQPKRRRILEGNNVDIYGAHYGRASLYHRPEPGKLPIMCPLDVSHTH